MKDDVWYFAYGSNLWIEQKELRTSAIRTGGDRPRIARLTDFRFAFNKQGSRGPSLHPLPLPLEDSLRLPRDALDVGIGVGPAGLMISEAVDRGADQLVEFLVVRLVQVEHQPNLPPDQDQALDLGNQGRVRVEQPKAPVPFARPPTFEDGQAGEL
jgi:hypothetical protein